MRQIHGCFLIEKRLFDKLPSKDTHRERRVQKRPAGPTSRTENLLRAGLIRAMEQEGARGVSE